MKQDLDIKYLVIIGISVMAILFTSFLVALIFSQRKKLKYQKNMQSLKEQQQNQLIEAAVRSEETERHRIAETLHDEVGAILSSAKLHLLGIKAAALDERDQQMHEKGGSLLNEVIQKVRGISHNLHSNILKEFGLNEAIRDFIKKTVNSSVIEADTNLDDHYMSENHDDDISTYRMIQELVNNILKYAGAKRLQISSLLKGDELDLEIFHNGDGLTQEQFEELSFLKEGLGLKNIRNRIILLKGSIRFSKDEDGYRIHIHVPVKSIAA
ncbi:MAG: ATP-binding protein [Chitinophagaceae bacterium]